jgi:tetratricopeptide (TPR) repeat protein
MMTLDERIDRLRPEVGRWKDELETSIKTLKQAGDYIAVLLKMSRWCLELLEQLYQVKREQPPRDRRLSDWIRDAQQKDLLPEEIASLMHDLRIYHNKADHAVERIALEPRDAELVLDIFLRVLEWFFWQIQGLETIYIPPKPARSRKTFMTPPQPPKEFVDRKEELAQILGWLDSEGCPVFIIGAMGGQGKTALAAKAVSLIRMSERAMQVRWVEGDENLSVDDLLNDFAEEMQRHNSEDARHVKDEKKSLKSRLDALIQFLEHSPDQWLLVLDDFHKFDRDKGRWNELVKFFAQRCNRTKLLILTRREPEAAEYPKLPIGSCQELRLPELPEEEARDFLMQIGLEVDEEEASQIWRKCSGSPLAMKLFAQAARRRGSIQRVLQLPLPEWTENARAWLEELQEDLSPAAKEAMKRLSVLSDLRPVEWELVVATGETPEMRETVEQGLDELDRAYLLQRSEDKLQLHDILHEYWLQRVLKESIEELGEEFKDCVRERLKGRKKINIIDAIMAEMLSVEYIDKGKINIWCNLASEWIIDNLPQKSVDPIFIEDIEIYFDFVLIGWNDCALNRIYLLLENRRQKGDIDKNEVENIAKKLLRTMKKIYPEYIDDFPISELYAKIVLIIADLLIQRGDIDEAQRLYYDSLDYIEPVFESTDFSDGYIEIIKAVCDLLKKQNREEDLFDLIKSEICEFEEDEERFYSILIELYEILSNLYHEKGNIELAEIYIQKANELKNKLDEMWESLIKEGFLRPVEE